MIRYFYVLAGGAAGSLLRYLVGIAVLSRYSGGWPLATFFVNVTGSFAIGIVLSRLPAASGLRPLLVTGILGGYTTFSSLEWETFAANQNGHPWLALLNILASVAAGYLACWAGASLK